MIVIYIYIIIKVIYYIWKVISSYRRIKFDKLNDLIFKYETDNEKLNIYLDKETHKLKMEHANSII